jgi:hypothetical protein
VGTTPSFGSASIVVDGAVEVVQGVGAAASLPGAVSGPGTFIKSGTGELFLNNTVGVGRIEAQRGLLHINTGGFTSTTRGIARRFIGLAALDIVI